MTKAYTINKIIDEMAIPRGFKKLKRGPHMYRDEHGYEYDQMKDGTWTAILPVYDNGIYVGPRWESYKNPTLERARSSAEFHRTKEQRERRMKRMGLL